MIRKCGIFTVTSYKSKMNSAEAIDVKHTYRRQQFSLSARKNAK